MLRIKIITGYVYIGDKSAVANHCNALTSSWCNQCLYYGAIIILLLASEPFWRKMHIGLHIAIFLSSHDERKSQTDIFACMMISTFYYQTVHKADIEMAWVRCNKKLLSRRVNERLTMFARKFHCTNNELKKKNCYQTFCLENAKTETPSSCSLMYIIWYCR